MARTKITQQLKVASDMTSAKAPDEFLVKSLKENRIGFRL